MAAKKAKIKVTKAGPYLVSGGLPLTKDIIVIGREDEPEKWTKAESFPKQDSYALCRCGRSGAKPYCDGSHIAAKFKGTETASMEQFNKRTDVLEGPKLILKDVPELCASARFCHRSGGTWSLTQESDKPKKRALAIKEAGQCPSGRLVACDKKGKPIEPKLKPSIGVIEDPQTAVSGPLWVKGGVQIESADGKKYERRNRCTLCRCGASKNKPFCDSSHIDAGFDDGDKRLKKR